MENEQKADDESSEEEEFVATVYECDKTTEPAPAASSNENWEESKVIPVASQSSDTTTVESPKPPKSLDPDILIQKLLKNTEILQNLSSEVIVSQQTTHK